MLTSILPRFPRDGSRARPSMLLLCIAMAIAPPALRAQPATAGSASLQGAVRDSAGAAIERATVSAGGRVAVTSASGSFRLDGLEPGMVALTVRRLGYRMRTFVVRASTDSAPVPIDVLLQPVPATLQPVMVEALRDGRMLRLAGFYERRRTANGRFITREQIEKRNPGNFVELLRSAVPGMQLTSGRTAVQGVRFRNSRCAPLVYLDGFPALAAEYDLLSINPEQVLAVEVYSGTATAPSQFRSHRGVEACGVIAVWFGIDRLPPRPIGRKGVTAVADAESRRVFAEHEVDAPARVDSARLVKPSYPDSLFARGAEGQVLAQFVVDADGVVDPASIDTEASSHPQFGAAVRRALLASRFVPARHRGVTVRQSMLLPYRFVLSEYIGERY